MKTKKQEELVNAYLAEVGEHVRPLYRDLIEHLDALGYNPQKQKSSIVFKHDTHNKQMAKLGFKGNKDVRPFFALRFSACRGYSQRVTDIVRDTLNRFPARTAQCITGGCGYCRGEAGTHVYAYTSPDGQTRTHCGAYALEIPDITADDIAEIKALITEEHAYLTAHEANTAV